MYLSSRLSHCCAFTVTFRSYLRVSRKDSREIRAGATARERARVSFTSPRLPLPPPYQSRGIILSRLDIYMAIAGVPTPVDGVRAPRPELKPPHYHGGPWRRAGVGPGGCALDEAAAGESVLRILEVMSRAVLYNTRSRPFQSRPLSASSYRPFLPALPAAAAPLPPRITGILMKNGNSEPVGLPVDIVYI